jgi:thiol peroxidase
MPAVTLKGNPVSLQGPELKVGDRAPDFLLQGSDMADVTLASSAGKTRVICSLPSLDTPVCSIETKKFNQSAAEIPGVEILVVSTDLPFAMKRWCGAEGVDKVRCASDHRDASFGAQYGVLIGAGPLSRCLTRAIFVVGPDDKIRHVEYVAEIATEPNYEKALAAAKG